VTNIASDDLPHYAVSRWRNTRASRLESKEESRIRAGLLRRTEEKGQMISFTIEGAPVPKGRPRFTRTGHTFTPTKTRQYEALVTARAREAMVGKRKIEKPNAVRVDILAVFPVPASWSKKRRLAALQGVDHHVSKPDLDNVQKAILDSMNGIVFEDDSQVIDSRTRKAYGPEPGVKVFIDEVKHG
jgi:Holliday junction resolvase RusA-like endonuclease